jgi:hypothetical protein
VKLISYLIAYLGLHRQGTAAPGSLDCKPSTNESRPRYIACWTEDDGIYFCGHEHETIAESMKCLVPDGGSFIRAFEAGVSRSLNEAEDKEFLAALSTMFRKLPDPVVTSPQGPIKRS